MLAQSFPQPESAARPAILHVFPNFSIGGPQKRFALIAGAPGDPFHHKVLATDSRYEARELLSPHADVAFSATVSRAGTLPARLMRYRACLTAMRPALIVTYNWGAIEWALASWSSNLPHIHIEDGFGPEEVDQQLARRIWFRRLALGRALAIVVPSRTLEAIAGAAWHFPHGRIRFIPNGVDLNAHRQARAHALNRSDLGLPPTIPIVGWVGALRKEKNLSRLLRAFAALRAKSALVLVGDGPERNRIEQEIATLNLKDRVRLLGTRADVERILPLFDVLALSSDTEQMPIAVLEGMAAGLPIAAIDVGDVRALVANENLPFIAERSRASLTAALEALLGGQTLRREIGAANLRRAEQHFSAEAMIGAYRALFAQAIAPRTNAPSRYSHAGAS